MWEGCGFWDEVWVLGAGSGVQEEVQGVGAEREFGCRRGAGSGRGFNAGGSLGCRL